MRRRQPPTVVDEQTVSGGAEENPAGTKGEQRRDLAVLRALRTHVAQTTAVEDEKAFAGRTDDERRLGIRRQRADDHADQTGRWQLEACSKTAKQRAVRFVLGEAVRTDHEEMTLENGGVA